MQNKDKFTQDILATLYNRAKAMPRHIVIDNVFQRIEEKRHQKYNRWGVGLAFAAAITGLSILPTSLVTESTPKDQNTLTTPKLSPQLADDLEMLLVLGEDLGNGR